jgi:predicted aspartyl protease
MNDKGDEAMGRVTLEVMVTNNRDLQLAEAGVLPREKVRSFHLQAVVDSGSTHLVLPADVAERLDLHRAGEITIRYADRRSESRPLVDQVQLEMLGRQSTFRAVLEPNRSTALVGAIVLEDLGFLVDCKNNKLTPRDPSGPVAEVECNDAGDGEPGIDTAAVIRRMRDERIAAICDRATPRLP